MPAAKPIKASRYIANGTNNAAATNTATHLLCAPKMRPKIRAKMKSPQSVSEKSA
jgi:hypothetical protein